MSLSFDSIISEFLRKISEFEFVNMDEDIREREVDSYLRAAVADFRKNCKYDLTAVKDDTERVFKVDEFEDYDADKFSQDIDELVDILSEGMIIQWMKPYLFRQENLELVINTRDFTTYSPAELLKSIRAAYTQAKKDYKQKIYEYSYNHNDLGVLHI